MSEAAQNLAVAKRFFDAIETGNVEAIENIYAPGVAVWHNTDEIETSKGDNLAVLKRMVKYISDRRYEQRRLEAFPGGFVQQHVLTGKRRDGVSVRLPACIVCAVSDGKITRLDEYFDSAAAATFAK